MSARCIEIINLMEEYASSSIAESWDNVGLILGDENRHIEKILVALDINDEVIDEAISLGCDLIITHHPLIFKGIKKINSSDITGRRIIKLIKNNIAVYTAHTNLDIAKNGTNETFAKLLGLTNIEVIFNTENSNLGIGRKGEFKEEITFYDLIQKVKNITNLKNLTVTGNLEKSVKNIAICTGSGGEADFIIRAKNENCDAYITGDIKYHNSQIAQDLGLCLIDATHYASEVLIIPIICQYINKCSDKFNLGVVCTASKVDGQTLKIV